VTKSKYGRCAELLLLAIAQARDEGEDIPDWLGEAEDEAIAILDQKEAE
jgi:hypothetical protein